MMITKKDLHAELITRYKEYFESKLAVSLLDQCQLFPAVEKISNDIYMIMNKHKTKILTIISNDVKISQELYDVQFYGRQQRNQNETIKYPEAHETWENMMKVLIQNESLPEIMQIHAIFMYRIAKNLKQSSNWDNGIPKINLNDRGRHEDMRVAKLSTEVGINKNKVFSKLMRINTYEHMRAVDKFMPDVHSRFFKNMLHHNLPFAGGLSGHTKILITSAIKFGLKKQEDLKEYLLACFIFLAAGGNHSFHEVMSIGKQIGLSYETGNYMSALPQIFKHSLIFKRLEKLFPDLLHQDNQALEINDDELLKSTFARSSHTAKHYHKTS